ncbi:MAG: serine hydrolase [Bacteroidales bacterium]|nr:serine hydrolase [Bacteroidales bacterium]
MKLRHFIVLAVCALAVSSCSIFRALKVDGKNGPTVYSYKKRQVDTIANGDLAFHFPVGKHAEWLDTLHFLDNQPYGDSMTFSEVIDTKGDNQAVLIIHNDSIVYEKYWGDYSADHMATIFSITKSITSLLCGIAIDDGYIHSVDDPVTDYLPELKKEDPMWQELTIRHLLDMRSGLDFDDVYEFTSLKDLKMLNAMAKLNYGHNIRKQLKGLKFRCKPGTQYRYESMTPAILGMVIERASGKSYAEYLSEKVWQPLGMNSAALVIIDSKKHDMAHTFGGVTMNIMDLAKIGRLYLNKGMWDGERIVSEDWIVSSTRYDVTNFGYHYNWYNLSYNNYYLTRYPGYFALGIFQQTLYVNPRKNLIIVRLGSSNRGYAYIPALFERVANAWR